MNNKVLKSKDLGNYITGTSPTLLTNTGACDKTAISWEM